MSLEEENSFKEIAQRCGLDCGSGLEWRKWEPGGEYVKKLAIRNITNHNLKFKYKLPATRYFSLDFPETKILSAGMACNIEVTFRPILKEPYEDFIEFVAEGGSFKVPIRAYLQTVALDIPNDLDFEYGPAMETSDKNFMMKNVGELDAGFTWVVPEPFNLIPSSGIIKPGASLTVKAQFSPKDGSVFHAVAVCRIGDQYTHSMRIKGIGKYPFIILDKNAIEFGDCFVGRISEQFVTLTNKSSVRATFTISRQEKDTEPCFYFSPMKGVVPADGNLTVQVHYAPHSVGAYTSDNYTIKCPGGAPLNMKCTGTGIGPRVTLSSTALNFGSLVTGQTTTRVLYINNNSNIAASFQIVAEKNGIFRFDRTQGSIGANSSTHVTIRFTPTMPINYYKRLYCLIHGHHPLYVDLLGSSYSETVRPPPVTQRHVERFYRRRRLGLSSIPPEKLEEVLNSGQVTEDLDQASILLKSENSLFHEYFEDGRAEDLEVRIEEQTVDFGSCYRNRMIEPKLVHVTNHTNGKVTCNWIMPEENPSDSLHPVFEVMPQVADIKPNSTMSFQVYFKPSHDNQSYGRLLDCVIFYKTMRNFRLVTDDLVTPPWCLTVPALGSTSLFEATFIPDTHLEPKKLIFPACLVSSAVYNTVVLTNTGDTPVKFQFPQDQQNVFSFQPAVGVVASKSNQIVVCKFTPSSAKRYKLRQLCILDGSSANTLEINLSGAGNYPKLLFENEGLLNLKPTLVDVSSTRPFSLRNPSRIPVDFEWRIPEKYSQLLSVNPATGCLRENQSTMVNWTFSPQKAKRHKFVIPCHLSSKHDSGAKELIHEDIAYLTVMGEGLDATITMSPAFVDFSTVLVGSKAKKELTLTNNNNCTLNYSLTFRESNIQLLGKYGIHSRRPGKPPIRVEPSTGELPPRTSKVVTIIFCPVEHSLCTTKLECRLRLGGSNEESSKSEEADGQKAQNLPSCEVSGTGAFPSLQIADVRSSYLSTHQLWRQLKIEDLNAEFSTDPAADEMSESGSSADIFNKTFKLDFGAIEYGSEPCDTTFLLENTQCLPVTWRMKFPNEYEVDVERWAENGILSESETAIATILDHNIFAMSEKTGTLQQGEKMAITVTYTPILVGLHELPVLVEFSNGKKMAVTFACRTLRSEDPYLHIYEPSLNLVPMPIGGDVYPVQYYELFNAGPGSISFNIDPAPLEKLKADNMNCDVIKCDVIKGDIAGGSRFLIPFIFQPLEEKTYDVQLDIQTSAGETHQLSVNGQGHLPHKERKDDAPKLPQSSVPRSQKYQSAKQIALLSKEVFDFGYVPINCVKREILSIKNTSDKEIFFHWDISNPTMAQILDISPPSGLLTPDQSIILAITYKPGPVPSVHDFDIICTLGEAKKILTRPNSAEPVGEVLLAQSIERPYASRGNMKSGLSPRKHQSVTTRTTKSFLNRTFMNDSKASGKSSANRTGMDSVMGQDAVIYSRSFPSPVAEVADESGSKRYQINNHNYPLHLRLRAVALTVAMYKQLYSNYPSFFSPLPVPAPLRAQGRAQPPPLDMKQLVQFGGASLETMVTEIISELVMEGVNDPSVQEAYDNLPDEPVPYYVRIHTPAQLLNRNIVNEAVSGESDTSKQSPAGDGESASKAVVNENRSTSYEQVASSADEKNVQDRKRPLLRDPIFSGILENIFENTIYSLIREMALEDEGLNLRKPTAINIQST